MISNQLSTFLNGNRLKDDWFVMIFTFIALFFTLEINVQASENDWLYSSAEQTYTLDQENNNHPHYCSEQCANEILIVTNFKGLCSSVWICDENHYQIKCGPETCDCFKQGVKINSCPFTTCESNILKKCCCKNDLSPVLESDIR
jgi:hypothetical protein